MKVETDRTKQNKTTKGGGRTRIDGKAEFLDVPV